MACPSFNNNGLSVREPVGVWVGMYGQGEPDYIGYVVGGNILAKMYIKFDGTLDVYDIEGNDIGYFQGPKAQDEALGYLNMWFAVIS